MSQTSESQKQPTLRNWKLMAAIVLVLSYAGAATYGIMSDTSIRGLTVKMFSVSRSCTVDPSTSLKTLTYSIGGSIWSSTSLTTSLSHMTFRLSVDGAISGTATRTDSSFGPGQSISFNLAFTNPTLNPTALPLPSRLVLTLTATVGAGLYTSMESAADSTSHLFGSASC